MAEQLSVSQIIDVLFDELFDDMDALLDAQAVQNSNGADGYECNGCLGRRTVKGYAFGSTRLDDHEHLQGCGVLRVRSLLEQLHEMIGGETDG